VGQHLHLGEDPARRVAAEDRGDFRVYCCFRGSLWAARGRGAETAEGYESEADEGSRVAKAEGLAHEQPDRGVGRLDECVGQAEGEGEGGLDVRVCLDGRRRYRIGVAASRKF